MTVKIEKMEWLCKIDSISNYARNQVRAPILTMILTCNSSLAILIWDTGDEYIKRKFRSKGIIVMC
jgi:hypothetical protein